MKYRTLQIMLLVYVCLALLYAYATPIFEAPDEYYHFGMVQKLATDWTLPVQSVDDIYTAWHQEGSQPPLYYMLSAVLVTPFNRDDFDEVRQLNPHAVVGRPDILGNKNRVLHNPVYPPPLYGTTLAVYVVRVFSIVLGAITVFAVYNSALILVPSRPTIALIASGLVAFNPQFLFISAAVNNDNLVTALNSLIIWQTLITILQGFKTQRSILLAILIALATLSKLGGLVMVLMVALAGLYVGIRDKNWRGLLTLGFAMVVVWGFLASWWYIRNIVLYGELFGIQTMLNIFGRRDSVQSSLEILQTEGQGLRESYWGLFGWFSISAPTWFYTLTDMLTLLVPVGFVATIITQGGRRLRDERTRQTLVSVIFLGLTLGVGFVSFMSWTMQTYASQGRLLFPYTVCIALLMAIGLAFFWRGWAAKIAIGLWAGVALYMPLAIIIPAYAPQATLAQLPATASAFYARYGDIELVGYAVEDKRYGPTDKVDLTLYWQPLRSSDNNLSVFVHLVKPSDTIIASVTSYPNYGSRYTRTWQPNVIYSDTYTLEIPGYEGGAYPLEAWVGWWQFPENEGVGAVDRDGNPIGVVRIPIGGFATLKPSVPPIPTPLTGDFGGVIRLQGYAWQETGELTLWWESLAPMSESYTVFVFMSDNEGVLVAQGDAPPSLATQYWQVGEQFTTQHRLQGTDIVDGTYTLEVGWYRRGDFMRLETRGTDNRFNLGQVQYIAE